MTYIQDSYKHTYTYCTVYNYIVEHMLTPVECMYCTTVWLFEFWSVVRFLTRSRVLLAATLALCHLLCPEWRRLCPSYGPPSCLHLFSQVMMMG